MVPTPQRRGSDANGQSSVDIGNKGDVKGVAILDFLFTFSLAGGLVPEALGPNDQRGLLSEQWIKTPSWPSSGELGEALTLLFALLTLTFSWYGYHESIRWRPHRSGKWQGFARFQIDVLLILLYGVLLLSYRRIEWALMIGVVIYGLYTIWDLLEASEYREDHKALSRNWLISARWLGLFTAVWFVTRFFSPSALLASTIAIVLNISYRIIKIGSHGA